MSFCIAGATGCAAAVIYEVNASSTIRVNGSFAGRLATAPPFQYQMGKKNLSFLIGVRHDILRSFEDQVYRKSLFGFGRGGAENGQNQRSGESRVDTSERKSFNCNANTYVLAFITK